MIRVSLVDGSRVFAEALSLRLDQESDLCVTHPRWSAAGACLVLPGGAVDVLVCDEHLVEIVVSMPHAQPPPPDGYHVVVLAEQGRSERLAALLRNGIAGWVTRDEPIERLIETIRGVARGETWIPPSALTRVLRDLTSAQDQQRQVDDRLRVLTQREREILVLLGEGLGRAEVAARLHLSQHTVRSHLQNIRACLAVHSTLAAVAAVRDAKPAP